MGKALGPRRRKSVQAFRTREMKHLSWTPIVAVLAVMLASGSADAGLFGLHSYRCCPTESCAPCGDYCAAKTCCAPCYQTVQETVWEKQDVVCTKTVYDQVCEQVPYTCVRNVYDTQF